MQITKTEPRNAGRARAFRAVVLVAILVLATALGVLHQFGAVKPVGVDALCPFGGIEAAFTLLRTGRLMQKVAWSSFFVLGAVLVVALVFRRSFCGQICPLGALQEGAGLLGRKVLKRRLMPFPALDRFARFLKYLVLVLVVVFSTIFGSLVVRPYDPWATWQHLVSAELFSGFLVGLVVLVLSLVGSFFYERFFCKYLCPMGAFLGLVSRFSLFKVKRDPTKCIECGACDAACPANIPVSRLGTLHSAECLDCDACVNACPAKGALVIAGPRNARIGPAARTAAVLGLFVLVVGAATLTGAFEWRQKGIKSVVLAESGAFDPALIRGSDSWKDIAAASGIPEAAFVEAFRLDPARLGEAIKIAAHAEVGGFEVEAVRDFVRARLRK